MGRTLIVDDDADMRVILRATINHHNDGLIVVGEATSGEDAIAVRAKVYPDLIVLDQRMPDMSGVDTARALLRDDPDLGIVLYGAYIDDDVLREAEAIGIRGCVVKGDTQALLRMLHDLDQDRA